MRITFSNKYFTPIILALALFPAAGCNKYLSEPLPANTISEENAFISDNSISAVVTASFIDLINTGVFGGSPGSNLAYVTGLYTDELQDLTPNSGSVPALFYADAIEPTNISYWSDFYYKVYVVNSTLRGIQTTTANLYNKNQWLGESYFTRALHYFYLTNLFGNVPLALTPDYTVNNVLSRAPQSEVYQQIIADLQQARSLLNYTYTDAYGAATSHRTRPNRYAATALLAKAYLYTQKWDSAEIAADSVINNSSYALLPTNQVFAANGKETIWALAMPAGQLSYEYQLYNKGMPSPIVPPSIPTTTYSVYAAMDTALVNAFEPGDNRYTNWVRAVPDSGSNPAVTWYFPNKYFSSNLGDENEIVLRLGELYLIRAEARAQQNNISGAASDLNAVRARAGLPNTTASDQASLLSAIARERRVELFTECGHRFFDLKRTGTIDAVMTAFAPTKGATWSDYMQLFPIPTSDLIQDPNLTANPGYQQ